METKRAFYGRNRETAARSGRVQDWYVGAVVNVGFLKGLEVTGRDADGAWLLRSGKGAEYAFAQSIGLVRTA